MLRPFPTLNPARMGLVVAALGTAQALSWASSYYLPAILAPAMAAEFGHSPVLVFGAFSGALVLTALASPAVGRRIDRMGGRGMLMASNMVLAAGLALLGLAPGIEVLALGWALIGLGMAMGLYEAGFATLTAIYGAKARGPITGITLIAGFASTLGWPVSGLVLAGWGWREACLLWAVVQLALALPLNALLPQGGSAQRHAAAAVTAAPPPTRALVTLAFVFAATMFTAAAMAAHLPGTLQAAGASLALALAAGALVGPAQVAARLMEFGLLQRFHPLASARLAAASHPVAALVLALFGGPAAWVFALIHGAGNGLLTIARGTLPLALFGPEGYGQRLGWLSLPARLAQAAAPLAFGAALQAWGAGALWLTAVLGLAATLALMTLRRA